MTNALAYCITQLNSTVMWKLGQHARGKRSSLFAVWPDWAIFSHLAIFYLGTFLKFPIYQQFQNMICCAYFNIRKQDYKVKFDTLVADLATFQTIGPIYFQSSGHSAYLASLSATKKILIISSPRQWRRWRRAYDADGEGVVDCDGRTWRRRRRCDARRARFPALWLFAVAEMGSNSRTSFHFNKTI